MLALEAIYRGRTLNLAHRGAREAAPENTLPAFVRAVEMGADGVELDVHLTFDDVPICLHSFTLEETTDGTGYPSEFTLEQIKEFDAGMKFDAAFAGTPIPSLAEVFEAIPNAFVNVELKSLTFNDTGLERAVLDVIRAQGAEARVIISSFNPFCLRRMRKLAPDLPLGQLTDSDLPIVLRKGWLLFGIKRQAIHPHHTMVDARYMQAARKKNWRVNTWTVNEPEDMRRLLALGVDSIMTDRPDLLKTVMDAGV